MRRLIVWLVAVPGAVLAILVALGVVATVLHGCLPPPDGCQPRASRCHGTVAQTCSATQRWVDVADCAPVGASCCAAVGETGRPLHACLPTCPPGDGGAP